MNPSRLLAAILTLAPLAAYADLKSATKPDAPMMSATTVNIGQHIANGAGLLNLGAKVDLHFLKAPQSDYQVQCFFVARVDSPPPLAYYIFDTQVESSKEPAYTKTFQSTTIFAGQPFLLLPGGTPSPSRELIYSPYRYGKIYGWVVRIVSQGVTVGVQGNQSTLVDAVKRDTKEFDAAAKAVTQ